MKAKFITFLVAIVAIFSMTSCVERVDAGHEGIKVNLYGSNKGVDDISLVTGAVWYNPITERVYEYPTYVQTVNYEEFTITSKDGAVFSVDPTLSIKVIDGETPKIFKKYRKDLNEVINTTLYNYIKNAFRIELNKYNTEDLVSKREEFEQNIEQRLIKELTTEGFALTQLTSGLKYPESLSKSIDAKNAAVQEALKITNEIKAVEAQAQKAIAKANGEAEALKIKANAEAYYNKTVSQSMSPMLLQAEWIEKWSGVVPTVSGNNNLMLDLKNLK